MRKELLNIAAGVFLMFSTSPAAAAAVSVTGAWFRALPSGLPAAGYFSLHNAGARAIELTGAESSACGMVMLHRSSQMSGISRMEEVKSVAVGAGDSLVFAPGGYHLMCTQPTAAMKPGGRVSVTLHFAGGVGTTAAFAVRGANGK